MRLTFPMVAAATALWVAVCGGAASAAPAAPAGIERPASGVEIVRTRHRHHMRRRAMRGRMAPAAAGNAKNPNMPAAQQNRGNVSGGPR